MACRGHLQTWCMLLAYFLSVFLWNERGVVPCQSFSLKMMWWSEQRAQRRSTFRLFQHDVNKEPENSQFGRKDYWNSMYETESNFSWYAGWDDLEPFIREFVDPADKVLIPGVGNDAMLVDMFEGGYRELTAMDYAPEGIARCRGMLGPARVRNGEQNNPGVFLVVADARELSGVFENESFDAVIEKGTLDAIYLSGGRDKALAHRNLNLAICELGRCVKPGGMWISITAVVAEQIQDSFDQRQEWTSLVRGEDLFVTADGYTSNNIDGSLLVWRKK